MLGNQAHAGQRLALHQGLNMILPDLTLLLHACVQKALQHLLRICTSLIVIGIAPQACRAQMQAERLPGHRPALQALPLMQQLMGEDASHHRVGKPQRLMRVPVLKKAARQIDAPAAQGQRAPGITQTPHMQTYAGQQFIQRSAEKPLRETGLDRHQASPPEHHATGRAQDGFSISETPGTL